jgi:hypothetical protein
MVPVCCCTVVVRAGCGKFPGVPHELEQLNWRELLEDRLWKTTMKMHCEGKHELYIVYIHAWLRRSRLLWDIDI